MTREADHSSEVVQGAPTPSLSLAVIGHVNHGKTALVRALTGMETDRLKEEIERGLSITLGFAHAEQGGVSFDLIDAPGHEDYIRAMVSGTAGARAVLLVISATEGFGRQTYEHLAIAAALGLEAGLVVVTKADLLEPGDEAAVISQITADLRGTILEGQPIILCSAHSGVGLDAVRKGLRGLAHRCPIPAPLAGAFLPIDRAFSLTGAGTVVTGTLQGAGLRVGEAVELWPSGQRASVRQLQIHNQSVGQAAPGGRVAVNLRGLSAKAVASGEVLCSAGAFAPSAQVDVMITLSEQASKGLKHTDQIKVLWGARQDMASLRLMEAGTLAPGQRALAQLRFATPVVAYGGQRAVLRRPSPVETLGSITVLDPLAPLMKGRSGPRLALLAAVAAGGVEEIVQPLVDWSGGILSVAEAARLTRLSVNELLPFLVTDYQPLGEGQLVRRADMAAAKQAYLAALKTTHTLAPTRAAASVGGVRKGLAKDHGGDLIAHAEQVLAQEGLIRLEGAKVALASHDPLASLSANSLVRLGEIEARLLQAGLMPPDVATVAGSDEEALALMALLVETGRAVALRNGALRQTLTFHHSALLAAVPKLRGRFPPPQSFATGEARAALETTRKYIVPVLEYLDRLGLTRRDGDVRQVLVLDEMGPNRTGG
jgi:selenocysteine-specific elongation factor